MKVEYINPFIISTKATFSTMLDCRLTRSDVFATESYRPHHDVTGIIGLSGKAYGAVALSLSSDIALEATERMLLEMPPAINGDVVDAVGELANMVAGGAKAQLEKYEMRITLPTVLVGKTQTLGFPSGVIPICISFTSDWGDVTVQAGLVEQAQKALAG